MALGAVFLLVPIVAIGIMINLCHFCTILPHKRRLLALRRIIRHESRIFIILCVKLCAHLVQGLG